MKKFLPFLASLLLASVSWGQTGTGVILLTDASYTFTPTTVDSSTTFNLTVQNDVGIAQTVFFGGLDAPFSLSNSAPVEIAGQSSVDFSISFTPSAIGSFTDTLEVIGDVFGSASLIVSGDGIQVQLEWTPDTLAFETTPIGQTSIATVNLSSVGDGDAVITAIEFSDSMFYVDSTLSDFVVAEDATGSVVIVYEPSISGYHLGTMILETNDPVNSEIIIHLNGTAVSEISGELCGLGLSIENSPYTLVGDILVPEGCHVTIDPGVTISGLDFNFTVLGSLSAIGGTDNRIQIEVSELLSHSSSMYLEYCDVTEGNSSATVHADLSSVAISNATSNDVIANLILDNSIPSYNQEWFLDQQPEYPVETSNGGSYFENFEQGCSDWSYSGSYLDNTNCANSELFLQSNYCGCWSQFNIYSPTISTQVNDDFEFVQYDIVVDTWNSSCQGHIYAYIQIDDGEGSNNPGWIQVRYDDCMFNGNVNLNIEDLQEDYNEDGKIDVQFRWNIEGLYYNRVRIDNFYMRKLADLSPNLYTQAASASNALANTSSTFSSGSLVMKEVNYDGDLEFLSDSTSILIENSVINGALSNSSNTLHFDANQVQFLNSADNGLTLFATTGTTSISESRISNSNNRPLNIGHGGTFIASGLEINNNFGGVTMAKCDALWEYSLVDGNGYGFIHAAPGTLHLRNCKISNNGGTAVLTAVPCEINHSNIAFNAGTGLILQANNFHTLNNSILWGNNSSNYTQIDIGGGVISTSYSTVQGRSSYGTSGSGQYYWGEGVIEADPLFSDDDLHLEIFSPCVDGGQPWHQDAYMPFGLGGVRADMGMYGGPDNAYWGGQALPDGASALTGVSDSPQDQGGVVGLVFDASFYDNSDLVNNVTSYAFWRHYDPTGQSIGTLDEGNWELIGEMPAQSFNGYAYQAQTLGNTNAFGTFNSCYTVVAQTDDPDTYWYSNVLCGESVDNLAPVEPELEGMVLETGGVTVFWELPSEEDYAYTEVTSDAGFTAEVTGDTLAVDLSAELGGTYTYTAVHYDVNGNASDPASLTLALEPGVDVITLNAGWNLISTDRAVTQGVDEVFASLAEGNLQYVTGFDGGVQFYDPNGLSFLNTLGSLTPGNGYWVKVAADDVLEVSGVRLAEDFMPGLAEGWNLVGYAAETPTAPGEVFADLQSTGDLLYVTGFDQGIEVYDPNGLPFLNSLTEMRNGFGYWVKSAVATDGDVLAPLADDVLPAEMPTPRYDVVNGVSELGAYAGEFVDVVNGWGATVARLPILEGGHLMTTALFGDDPSTGAVEGLSDGEELHFAFRGAMANETLVFGGNMAHKTLSLTFDEVGVAMGMFPNPASDVATFRFQLDMDAQVELALVDLAGRQVAVLLDANKAAGQHAETLALPAIPAGAYTVQLRVGGEVAGTQRLVVTH